MSDFQRVKVLRTQLPSATLIDVTLRDGGFHTAFHWSRDEIAAVACSVTAAGADYVELGYIGGIPELHGVDDVGLAADLPVGVVREVARQVPSGRLAAMVHPGARRTTIDFAGYRDAGLSLVRFVYHPSWRAALSELLDTARSCDLRVSVNLALASHYAPEELAEQLASIAAMAPDVVYVADTCAGLLPQDVSSLVRAAVAVGGEVGFHAHDHLSLALANSMVAAQSGATWVDASLWGLGRGAGNLRAELWLALRVARGESRYRLTPLMEGLDAISRKLDLHASSDFASVVCGSLNLAPPQEDALRARADHLGWPASRVAASLCESAHLFDTLDAALAAIA